MAQLVRFRSSNYPNHYARHCNYTLQINPNTDKSDLYLKDSTFKLTMPAISGDGNFVSLESVNFPNYYVRHCGFRIRIDPRQETQLYKDDASFKMVAALNGRQGYISFESRNYPGRFIRHRNFQLWLDPYSNAQLYKDDASFLMEAAPQSLVPQTQPINAQQFIVQPVQPVQPRFIQPQPQIMVQPVIQPGQQNIYAQPIQGPPPQQVRQQQKEDPYAYKADPNPEKTLDGCGCVLL